MKYCVIKDTIKVIDGSENPLEIMLQNAKYAGYEAHEVEILVESEYQARKELEPIAPQPPSEEERLEALEQAMLEIVMGGM